MIRQTQNKVQVWDFLAQLPKVCTFPFFQSSHFQGVETIVSYINPLGWFSTKNGANNLITAEDFKCVHTNWYGRRLRRNFRFGEEQFERLHPETGDSRYALRWQPCSDLVSATRLYSEIAEVKIESTNAFVIKYLDGGFPDHIEASVTDIRKILNILSYKLPQLAIETVTTRGPTV